MSSPILKHFALGMPWQTLDPFLFCVYHRDHFPKGNQKLGPASSLAGRHIGQDFVIKDGWRMYHGAEVPGFPGHPHRGFETITVVTQGVVDHADSLGAAGRYGGGDAQWMTAGNGVQHSEMFPLIEENIDNPLELFQIWLNLPAKSKTAEPHFAMLWQEQIPIVSEQDAQGNKIELTLVAGAYQGQTPPPPPPDSWAAEAEHDVAVWLIRLAPNAEWTLPTANSEVNRNLYCFKGELSLSDQSLGTEQGVSLDASQSVSLHNGPQETRLLLLQGRPIKEPVVQYGPFVMNNQAQIEETFRDYQATQFGGWPWPSAEPVHPREMGRFARYPDGHEEIPLAQAAILQTQESQA